VYTYTIDCCILVTESKRLQIELMTKKLEEKHTNKDDNIYNME